MPESSSSGLRPKLCHIRRWPIDIFNGYGFSLVAEKGKTGHFMGKIDKNSPAAAANLRPGDMLVEVNGANVRNQSHEEVVRRIKERPTEVQFLVADVETARYCTKNNIRIRSAMSELTIVRHETPVQPPQAGSPKPKTTAPVNSPPPKSPTTVVPASKAATEQKRTSNLRPPRLCTVRKWPGIVQGFGFNLHAVAGQEAVQLIGKVDKNSPAEYAGLEVEQRVVEVNNANICNENHKQIVERIRRSGDEVTFLVVDSRTWRYCKDNNIIISQSMPEFVIEKVECPTTPPDDVKRQLGISLSVQGSGSASPHSIHNRVIEEREEQEEANSKKPAAAAVETETTTVVVASNVTTNDKPPVLAQQQQPPPPPTSYSHTNGAIEGLDHWQEVPPTPSPEQRNVPDDNPPFQQQQQDDPTYAVINKPSEEEVEALALIDAASAAHHSVAQHQTSDTSAGFGGGGPTEGPTNSSSHRSSQSTTTDSSDDVSPGKRFMEYEISPDKMNNNTSGDEYPDSSLPLPDYDLPPSLEEIDRTYYDQHAPPTPPPSPPPPIEDPPSVPTDNGAPRGGDGQEGRYSFVHDDLKVEDGPRQVVATAAAEQSDKEEYQPYSMAQPFPQHDIDEKTSGKKEYPPYSMAQASNLETVSEFAPYSMVQSQVTDDSQREPIKQYQPYSMAQPTDDVKEIESSEVQDKVSVAVKTKNSPAASGAAATAASDLPYGAPATTVQQLPAPPPPSADVLANSTSKPQQPSTQAPAPAAGRRPHPEPVLGFENISAAEMKKRIRTNKRHDPRREPSKQNLSVSDKIRIAAEL